MDGDACMHENVQFERAANLVVQNRAPEAVTSFGCEGCVGRGDCEVGGAWLVGFKNGALENNGQVRVQQVLQSFWKGLRCTNLDPNISSLTAGLGEKGCCNFPRLHARTRNPDGHENGWCGIGRCGEMGDG